jgi:hypothetical protein
LTYGHNRSPDQQRVSAGDVEIKIVKQRPSIGKAYLKVADAETRRPLFSYWHWQGACLLIGIEQLGKPVQRRSVACEVVIGEPEE